MNIHDIIVCPICKSSLNDELRCTACGAAYTNKFGIYSLVSEKLSSDLAPMQMISDKQVEEMLSKAKPKPIKGMAGLNVPNAFKAARDVQSELLSALLEELRGTVCDLATGMGITLQRLVSQMQKQEFELVCTDIDRNVLAMGRHMNEDDPRLHYVATDCRHMAFRDNSFDYITSYSAIECINDTGLLMKELHRTLKPGGKIIAMGQYADKGSKTHERWCTVGDERSIIEEFLLRELEAAGFVNIESTIAGSYVGEENNSVFPYPGETIYMHVLQAQKP